MNLFSPIRWPRPFSEFVHQEDVQRVQERKSLFAVMRIECGEEEDPDEYF
jgi:hypothetical protein